MWACFRHCGKDRFQSAPWWKTLIPPVKRILQSTAPTFTMRAVHCYVLQCFAMMDQHPTQWSSISSALGWCMIIAEFLPGSERNSQREERYYNNKTVLTRLHDPTAATSFSSYSSKYDTLRQCWFDVGPASQTSMAATGLLSAPMPP